MGSPEEREKTLDDMPIEAETHSAGPADVADHSRAVFLSYASQDAEAARKICDALRGAGIEVWFDQSELRGGDAWDQAIRKQIKACALFIPIISRHAHDRIEGYFRLEWKLAVDRSHLIAPDQAFLLPVAIDATPQSDERIPDRFRELQWTRLPGGQTSHAFVERVRRLLSPEAPETPVTAPASGTRATTSARQPPSSNASVYGAIAIAVVACVYVVADKIWPARHSNPPVAQQTAQPGGTEAAFDPPPHSIAVLPFVNMSGDASQSYFSDGLTEELLNSLSRINELQVAARTSSFSFQGEHPDIQTVAHKLNVAAVLEGSVRRSARTVRITAQLVNGTTGYHLWSQTYDRDLGDVLQIQTEIASAVARALKVTLLSDAAVRLESGGTRVAAALDAYLRATNAHFAAHSERSDEPVAISAYSEAIRLDPDFSLAYAGRSMSLGSYAAFVTGQARHDANDKAEADARQAIALTPELAEGYLALASHFERMLDFAAAVPEYKRAMALAPGNARVLRNYGRFAVNVGWTDTGLSALRRALVLDPLNVQAPQNLGLAYSNLRRYDESNAAYREALKVDADHPITYVNIGINYFSLGDFQTARSWCEAKPAGGYSSACLALTYNKLGRRSDAEAALTKFTASFGDEQPYIVALIYAQWGNADKALYWLDKAVHIRDFNIEQLRVEPLLDPLRNEPRFQAIERQLKFPE